jgi:hypothetical protein
MRYEIVVGSLVKRKPETKVSKLVRIADVGAPMVLKTYFE